MDRTDVILLIVFCFLLSIIVSNCGYEIGVESALESVKSCTKDSRLTKQDVNFSTWVCNNGQWSKLDD